MASIRIFPARSGAIPSRSPLITPFETARMTASAARLFRVDGTAVAPVRSAAAAACSSVER